ncbi:MAG: porin [bacterium]
MKERLLKFGICVLVLFASVAIGWAEETKIGNMTLDELKAALGLSVYVQGGYTYNFEDPESQENEFRVFDHKANSFTLDLAQLVFTKTPPVNSVGYKVKLSAGETAKFIHSRGLGDATDSFDVTEAYISYVAPVGNGLRFDFGKWVTYHGAEVIEAKDNPNYSRSFLFNYAIPFTHTGLKVGYAFSDMLNAGIHIVNGWDNSDDNNKGKTLGASVGFIPIEQLSMVFNLMYGPEQDNDTANNRFLFDWVGIITPMKSLTLNVNVDYGTEENVPAIADEDAAWYGTSVIAKYDFSDLFSLAARAEYFNDDDGARTGTDQKLKEITITPEFRLAKNFLVRPEYRHDWSNEDVFDGGTKDTQDTIAVGVMYTW